MSLLILTYYLATQHLPSPANALPTPVPIGVINTKYHLNSTDIVTYVSRPTSRSTNEILVTCLVTYVISVWKSIHVNRIPSRSSWSHFWYKLTWALVGVFAPEAVLWVAVSQLLQARELQAAWKDNDIFRAQRRRSFFSKKDSQRKQAARKAREKGWTDWAWWWNGVESPPKVKGPKRFYLPMSVAQFAVMGGFVLRVKHDVPEARENKETRENFKSKEEFERHDNKIREATEKSWLKNAKAKKLRDELEFVLQSSSTTSDSLNAARGRDNRIRENLDDNFVTTIRSRGFLQLIKAGAFEDGSIASCAWDHDINDKSKADSISKAVVCVQVIWMLVQVVARHLAGFKVTLLELHVVIQVGIAIATYVLWWFKPMDPREPIVVEVKKSAIQKALQATGEHIQEFEDCGLYAFLSFPENQLPLFITETTNKENLYQSIARAAYDLIEPFFTLDWRKKQKSDRKFRNFFHYFGTRVKEGFKARVRPTGSKTSSANAPEKSTGLTSEITKPGTLVPVSSAPQADTIEVVPKSGTPAIMGFSVDETKKLPSANTTELGQSDSDAIEVVDTGSRKQTENMELPEKETWFHTIIDLWLRYFGHRAAFCMFALVGAMDGAIHLLAWNSYFPTEAESIIWKVACFLSSILPLGLLLSGDSQVEYYGVRIAFRPRRYPQGRYTFLKFARDLVRAYYRFGQNFFSEVHPAWFVPLPTSIRMLICFVVPLNTCIYCLSQVTIVFLAIFSMRRLPVDAYKGLNWVEYFPHF